jgi:hypothetical protein
MKHGMILALAALAVSAEPGASPTFRIYQVPLGAPAMRLIVAPLDAGATPDAAVLLRNTPEEVGLLTLRGSGNGRLTPKGLSALAQLGYGNTPTIAEAALDGDEFLDFGVAAISSGQVFLGDGDLFYTGQGNLPTAGGSQHGLGFTDLDGDGDLDSVLLVNDLGDWFLDIGTNNGNGSFSGNSGLPAPGTPKTEARLLFADVDNDGLDATFVVGGSGLAMSGFPGGPPTNQLLLAGSFGEVQAAHLNGDAFLDLALAAPVAGGVVVLQNAGGSFPGAVFFPTGRTPESLAAGDLTGDGLADLAVANRRDDNVAILAGDGAGGFMLVTTIPVAAEPVDIEVTDLEADGDLDLVVASGVSASLTVGLNRLVP